MPQEILDRIDKLNVWQRGSERAPHKPLLLLLALGRLSQGSSSSIPYQELAPQLEALLREFGPSRQSYHPEYPFWRLQNDGLWVVSSDSPMRSRKSNSDPPKSELLEKHAVGRLSQEFLAALEQNPDLLETVAELVLSAHFPESIHEDIRAAAGLALGPQIFARRKRDRRFRERVLVAYERRCAVCDLDLRLGSITIGLEAAHIRWHQAGGPDIEQNGLALCSTHHKTFDLGAFTVDPNDGLLVSEHVTGSSEFDHVLLRHHGRQIRPPQHAELRPDPACLAWHRREVFQEGPRDLLHE